MTEGLAITARQITKAQVLWCQYAQQTGVAGAAKRETRLEWVGTFLQRQVASFKELTRNEGEKLIDELLRLTGRGVHDRMRANSMGTDGRRGKKSKQATLASQQDLDRIREATSRLGWSEDRLERWLHSPCSPLRSTSKEIHTLADANRVWWALKNMIKGANKWVA